MVGQIVRRPCTNDHFSLGLRAKGTGSIDICMHDPLYNGIDYLWRTIPGFRLLHDDTKAIISLLIFNGCLVSMAVLVLIRLS